MAIPGPKGTFECVDESCVDELRVADGSFVDLISYVIPKILKLRWATHVIL